MRSNGASGRIPRWRLGVTYVAMIVVVAVFVVRMFSLQILRSQEFIEAALENRITRCEPACSPRRNL